MNYFIGADVGTTSVKVVAFDTHGNILSRHSCAYEMQHPHKGWSEQDPDIIFRSFVEATNKVVGELGTHQPELISFSAAMHSLIAVDKHCLPLTACIIWADNRSASYADTLTKNGEGQRLYELTGVPIHAMSPFCKLLWLRDNEPLIFNTAHKFIGIKEYSIKDNV